MKEYTGSEFICTLPQNERKKLFVAMLAENPDKEIISNGEKMTIREIAIKAMDGRLCDLEDTLDWRAVLADDKEAAVEQNGQSTNEATAETMVKALKVMAQSGRNFAVASPAASGHSSALGSMYPPIYSDPVFPYTKDEDNEEDKDL